MKITFRIYLVLLIILSLILGMPKTSIEQEMSLALNFTSSTATIWESVKVFLLLETHVLLLFLLTMRQNPAYRYFIVYFPIAYLLAYFSVTLGEYLVEPDKFLTIIPFVLCYGLCVVQYNSVLKADPTFALGLPEKPEDEYKPRDFDSGEPM